MSSSSEDELFLLDNIDLKIVRRKRVGVHGINRGRREFGKYHHIFLGRPTNEAKSVRDVFTTYFANNPLIYNM
jgi:hypothetical protein